MEALAVGVREERYLPGRCSHAKLKGRRVVPLCKISNIVLWEMKLGLILMAVTILRLPR